MVLEFKNLLANSGDIRDLWIARRSNQLIVKEISPGYLFEGLMLELKLQYFGY